MAEHPVPVNPVFLSASVPDPRRDPKYFMPGDSVPIRDAVIALLTVVLPRTKLIFGAHPAITPMAKWVADQLHAYDQVRMFQSKFFKEYYLKDAEVFHYEEVDHVPGDREKSLLLLREAMFKSGPFSAAFFIGGMEGVEQEYAILRENYPKVPRLPVYTTGGAARLIWQREWEDFPQRRAQLEQLRTGSSYVALFTNLIEGISHA